MTIKHLFQYLLLLAITGLTFMSFKGITSGEVVCFGDSITAGANVNGHSWVWYLSKDHAPVNFINAGRSGRKTTDRAELLPVLQKNPAANYYLIFLGVNDLKDGSDSMVNNCVINIKWMIATIRETAPAAKIVILSPCDINLSTMSPVNVQKKYNANTQRSLMALNKKYRKLAREEKTGFISLLHAVSKPNYGDGLHPDEKGQAQIAEAVWKGLK